MVLKSKNQKRLFIVTLCVALLHSVFSYSQFYNGLQMSFGKNRVQYREFLWQYYRFDKFDTYFYVNGKELAQYTAKIANEKIDKIQNYFQYSLDKRIIFVVYNKLSDFRQSNIGFISENDQSNIGGVTKIIDNKVFLYYEGSHEKFEQQITAAITEVVINEMLYGSTFKDRLANSTLLTLPEWYVKGLISYCSNGWNFEIEDAVKDGILNNKYKKFNSLTGTDAMYAGHSIWKFIALKYGEGIIPNIVYLTRVHKSAENGFLYVLGSSFADLTNDWMKYYTELYQPNELIQKLPESKQVLKNPKSNLVYQQAKISPDGKFIAYTSNEIGQYSIWLYNTETDKKKRIVKKEYKLEQITDYSYPIISWHPSGKILSFVNEYKGKIWLNLYEPETKKFSEIELFYFDKILDYNYSDDGFSLVISGVVKGQTDIFIHNLAAHTNQQITKDIADDLNPKFINNSSQIIFSSNRKSDSLLIDDQDFETLPTFDIFIYNVKSANLILTRITNTAYSNETQPNSFKKHEYLFLSDENGINNLFLATFDSTISYVDTTIHYRYFARSVPVTDYSRNIREFSVNQKGQITEIIKYKGLQHIHLSDFEFDKNVELKPLISKFKKTYIQNLQNQEKQKLERKEYEKKLLTEQPKKQVEIKTDTIINIYNYIFESEKKQVSEVKFPAVKELVIPEQRMYRTAFYNNYVVNQVDFSFLNTSYQKFTGGAVYYNPGLNIFLKLGVFDLFEDYRITAGLRFPLDFDSDEYLISLQNLKERKDKQYIYHRQTFRNYTDESVTKVFTNELMYVEKYPFSQVAAIRGTASMRYDKEVYLATDNTNLKKDNLYSTWAGLKFEFIFDNTIEKGLNLYNGLRFKIFSEAYFKTESKSSDLYIVGADFRHYLKIHRDIILASRFAASSSFGKSRLIYYLGSVDNWFNFSTKTPTFDNSVEIDQSQNFVYQTLATNMRGFSQNIRNGNSFALMNYELRFPVVKYFANKPIGNDFFANLQLVGFYDIGTAWSGFSPYSKKNAFNYIYLQNGPISVTIDRDIEPIVMGYGFGIHTRFLGYFMRADWAWGIEDRVILPKIFYLSLSLDF